MNDKFKLWGGGKMHGDKKVYRIQALKDFNDVKKGEKGGYIESEDNLSFKEGDMSWVYDDAIVHGKSTIKEDSFVDKDAIVKDSRLEAGSRVSHGAQVEHTRVTASEIQNSNTFYANIKNSNISHECVVKNARVTDSSIENGSEVYNSKVENSELVNDARVTKGAHVKNQLMNGENMGIKYDGENNMEHESASISNSTQSVSLSDDDLSDLNEPSKGMQQ